MNRIGLLGEFLGRLLWPLLKTGFPLKQNVSKSVSIPLELIAAAAATTDGATYKNNIWVWLSSFRLSFVYYDINKC